MSIEELWRTRPYTNPLSQVIDRMFEYAFASFTAPGAADGGSAGYQALPVNVCETEDAYCAALMARGLDEQTIDLTGARRRALHQGHAGFPGAGGSEARLARIQSRSSEVEYAKAAPDSRRGDFWRHQVAISAISTECDFGRSGE